ncbi:MAG TPA: hypothetical protein DDY37_07715 [Legionella sp.]|nr:hypothetical protein [Legionella sp.]
MMKEQSNGSLASDFDENLIRCDYVTNSSDLFPNGAKAAAADAACENKQKHTYSRFFTTVTAGVSASVLSAAVGSELLNAKMGNAYNTRSMVAASAVGGMALFTAFGAARFCLDAVSNPNINAWTALALGTGLAALSGVLGALMLDADDGVGLDSYLAAPALGAVLVGGASAIGLVAHARRP